MAKCIPTIVFVCVCVSGYSQVMAVYRDVDFRYMHRGFIMVFTIRPAAQYVSEKVGFYGVGLINNE